MSKGGLLVWFPFLAVAAWPAPLIQTSSPPQIEVRLYNYAEAAAKILHLAREEASRAYMAIGVSLRWVDCPTRGEDIPLYQECTPELPPNALVVRLLGRGTKIQGKVHPDRLGFAWVGGGIKRPFIAGVLYANVENLGFSRSTDSLAVTRLLPFNRFVGLVVGRVMAHEISHLLGVRTHGMGLMEAELTPWAIREAVRQRSGFSRKEARRILREVARRSGEQPAFTGGG